MRTTKQTKSFSAYLAEASRLSLIKVNMEPFLAACATNGFSVEPAAALFAGLPELSDDDGDYFETTILFNQLLAAQEEMFVAYQAVDVTDMNIDQIIAIGQTEKLKYCVELVFAQARYDLFDRKGNLHAELLRILTDAGMSPDVFAEKSNQIKWALFKSYVANIVTNSRMFKLMSSHIPTSGGAHEITLDRAFMARVESELLVQLQLMLRNNFSVVTDSDIILHGQIQLCHTVGADIYRLLCSDMERADEVILGVLSNPKLIETAMDELQFYDHDTDARSELAFHYGTQFLPELHLRKNHPRMNGELVDAFDLAELEKFNFSKETVMARFATAKAREALLLGCVISVVTNWYLKASNQPGLDEMQRVMLKRGCLKNIAIVLRGKLGKFVGPLEALTTQYYTPAARQTDEIRIRKEKIRKEFLGMGLLVAVIKHKCSLADVSLDLVGEFEYPATVLQKPGIFFVAEDVCAKLLSPTTHLLLSEKFSAELKDVAAILHLMRGGYLQRHAEFTSAMQELNVNELKAALEFFNEEKMDAAINKLASRFAELVSFEVNQSEMVNNAKHEVMIEIMESLRNQDAMSLEYLKGMVELCEHKLRHLQKLRECSYEYIEQLKRAEAEALRRQHELEDKVKASVDEIASLKAQNISLQNEIERMKLRDEFVVIPVEEAAAEPPAVLPAQSIDIAKWALRIAIGAAIVIGIAALIVAALFSAGVIVVPLTAVVVGVKLAIAGFVIGGTFSGGGTIAAIYEFFKARKSADDVTVNHGSSYQSMSKSIPFDVETVEEEAPKPVVGVLPDSGVVSSEETPSLDTVLGRADCKKF